MLKNRLTDILDKRAIGYEIIHHPVDFSALETAHDTHTAGQEFAKPVLLKTPGGPVMAVLQAPRMVDLDQFAAALDVPAVELMAESTLADLFPDCQVGAEPPFGHLYELPVYIDEALAAEEYITFNAGSHSEAVRIRYRDYEKIERPTRATFAVPR